MPLNRATNVPDASLQTPYVTLSGVPTALGGALAVPNRGTAVPSTGTIGDTFFNTATNELLVYTANGWVPNATKPNAPTNITVTSATVPYGGSPGAVIAWVPATTGLPATYYTVTSSTGGFSQTTSLNTATIIGLTSGTSYTFTVTAYNDYGSSSAISLPITPAVSPQPVVLGTPTPVNNGISIPIASGGATATSYTLYSNPGNIAFTSSTSPIVFPTTTPVSLPAGSQVSGLTAGTSYSFTGYSNNSAGTSSASSPSSTVLDTPGFNASNCILNYDFGNPASYGGENIFRASNNPTNTSYWSYSSVSLTSTSATSAPAIYPTGSGTVYKMTSDGTNNQHLIYQVLPITQSVGDIQTICGYFKAAEVTQITLTMWGASYPVFDLANGVVIYPNGVGPDVKSTTITPIGNGWYFCSATISRASASNTQAYIGLWSTGSTTPSTTITSGYGIYYYDACVYRNALVQTSNPGFMSNPNTSMLITYTGNTIYDLSGNNYNTGFNNCVWQPSFGNGSMQFNGNASSSASTATLPNLGTGYSNWGFSFWWYIPSGYLGGRMFWAGSPGYLYGDSSYANSVVGEWYYPSNVNIGSAPGWHQTTMIFSGGNTTSIYHDGYFEGSHTFGTSGTNSLASVILGNGYGGGSSTYNWAGNLGKLTVWNTAISASQVLQNFNTERIRFNV